METYAYKADRPMNTEIAVPVHLIQYIDQGVLDKLPQGTTAHGISPSGASLWARTAKIDATNEAGEETPFFIKVHQSDQGKDMAVSEYTSMSRLYSLVPEMVAEPIAWGTYTEEENVYFFVCRFRELSEDIPDVYDFPAKVAELHKRGVSKEGSFGHSYVTYSGRNPQFFPPSKSWEECFSKGLSNEFDLEEKAHGPDPEFQKLREILFDKIIPRLLRPLEAEGRKVTPTLVHGDLWDGNTSIDVETGLPLIFDAVTFFAHNEYELGPWWAPRHKMTDEYIAEYIKHFPPSEPADDFRDRGLLYRIRFDIHSSSLYPGTLRRRGFVIDTIRELSEKYSFTTS